MCILVIKKKGVKFPEFSTIKQCCISNPDGFSYALYDNKEHKLHTFKTMNMQTFLDEYCRVMNEHDCIDTTMIIHARIATHGSKCTENCHCWTANLGKEKSIAFAHNGILSIKNRENLTDSETFFRDIFVPIFKHYGWFEAARAIKSIIGSSKFAFLDSNGNEKHFGQFIDDNGILYSNTSYLIFRLRNASNLFVPRFCKTEDC